MNFIKKTFFISIILLFAGCGKYVNFKNTHASFPPQFKHTKKGLFGSIQLDPSMKYHIDGPDQLDWNKLTGLKHKYLKPLHETMMISWRYNETKDVIELMPYQHLAGERLFHNDKIISLSVGETLTYSIINTPNTWNVVMNDSLYIIPHTSSLKAGTYRTSVWFGGTTKSPRLIRYHLKRDRNQKKRLSLGIPIW